MLLMSPRIITSTVTAMLKTFVVPDHSGQTNTAGKKKEVGQLGRSENPRSGPWPVDSPTSDNRKITLLYYSGFFGKKKIPPYSETAKACPNNCFVTTDHKYADQADAFIVHARDYVSPVSKYKHKPWVLHCRENPAYSPKMRDSKEMAKFSYETTARLDSDFPFPSWRGVTTEGNGPSTYVKPFSAKRNVPIYASNSNCESVRTEYQKELMKYVGIDSYGSCLHNKDGLKKIYSKNFHKANADLQKEYKFTLVFMNADCDSWVDTRLLYALDAGSVPIFMGTEDVGRFLPGMEDSIIKVSDFENPKALAAYVKKVAADETLYNKYLAWKHRGPVNYSGTEMEAVQSNMANWYCNICDRIRQDPKAHPGRVKADQCYHRKRKDWLPTPKQYDPDNRASVPVIQDMFGVPRTIIVYMGQGKTSPPTWFEKLSMRPNTKSVWGIYGDKYIARSSSNVDILNVRGTTWTTGRNLLYSHAKSIYRGEDILYFVFFDGDVSPISFRSITPKTNLRTPIRTNESAIDYFERLLRTETPAVATVHSGTREFCAPEKYNACSTDTDAVISAIHTDAATLLLPYEHSHDRTSWWYSQAVFIEICEIAFPQSVVNYNSLQIINQEHSAYPRNGKYDLGEMKRDINNYLFSRFEEKCANKLFNRMNSTFILRRTKMNSCLVHPICKLKSDYKEETCAKRPKKITVSTKNTVIGIYFNTPLPNIAVFWNNSAICHTFKCFFISSWGTEQRNDQFFECDANIDTVYHRNGQQMHECYARFLDVTIGSDVLFFHDDVIPTQSLTSIIASLSGPYPRTPTIKSFDSTGPVTSRVSKIDVNDKSTWKKGAWGLTSKWNYGIKLQKAMASMMPEDLKSLRCGLSPKPCLVKSTNIDVLWVPESMKTRVSSLFHIFSAHGVGYDYAAGITMSILVPKTIPSTVIMKMLWKNARKNAMRDVFINEHAFLHPLKIDLLDSKEKMKLQEQLSSINSD